MQKEFSLTLTLMSVATVEQGGPWTLDDWFEMNERSSGARYELINGGLLVSPAPSFSHQWACDRISRTLGDAAPSEFWCVSGVGVEFLDDGYVAALMPDVVAAYRRKPEPRTLRSDSIVIAVEVVSPSSKANDRHLKPSLYAGAGIPHYWRIEIDSFVRQRTDALPIVFAYVLKDGGYVLEQRVGAGNLLQISDPFEISFDPAILADY